MMITRIRKPKLKRSNTDLNSCLFNFWRYISQFDTIPHGKLMQLVACSFRFS
jgi:hypothetical protein